MEFNGKLIYTESTDGGNKYRESYVDSIEKYMMTLPKMAEKSRSQYVDPVKMKNDTEYYRNQLIAMLGYPLTEYCHDKVPYTKEYMGEDSFCKLYRMQFTTLGNILFYGILAVPHSEGKHPLIIAQHGGWGSPEILCDMHGKNSYDNIAQIALENGCTVFCPQLLLWNNDTSNSEFISYPIDYDRFTLDAQLKQYGGSMTALEIYNIRKAIDCLCDMDCVDENNISMLGCSYGGYFTLYTTAIDTRISAAYASGFFNDRDYEFKSDWLYFNSARTMRDAEVAGLCAPRQLFIDVGKTDPVFNWETSVKESEMAREYFREQDAENNFHFNLWEGGHRFDINGPNIKEFINFINK